MIDASGIKAVESQTPSGEVSKQDFRNCMMGLFSAIGRTLEPEGWRMWYAVLKDLPLGTLQQAIVQWLAQNDSGFPTPAAIRKIAVELRDGPDPTYCDGLEDFFSAKRRFDPYYQATAFMESLHPTTRRAVSALGGAQWAADLMVDDRSTWTAQLREALKVIIAEETSTRRLPESMRPRIQEHRTHSATVERIASAMAVPAGVE